MRVLQENEFVRVGGTAPIKFNIRIISATNKKLQDEINKGLFRDDLYFRLTVVPITVPSLRERKQDIPLLAKHFLKNYSLKNGKRELKISEEALAPLIQYDWPGNIRELKNYIERLVIMSDGDVISQQQVLNFLPLAVRRNFKNEEEFFEESLSLKEHIERFEKRLLLREYLKANQNVSRMAELLRTDRPNLHRKLVKFGIKS